MTSARCVRWVTATCKTPIDTAALWGNPTLPRSRSNLVGVSLLTKTVLQPLTIQRMELGFRE